MSWYYNSAEDRYKWFGDNDTVEDGFTSVVGTRGNDDRGVGSFVYQTENGWVRLNPYTNSFSTFDTRDAATSDFSSVYQCNCQGLVNTIADESVRKGTTVALAAGTAVVIGTGAGVVMAATGTAAGAGITTLGLTSAGTSTAATTATAATATALPQFANSTVTQAVRTVMSDPNKIHHIFNNAGHGLGRLTQQLGGQSNTIRAVVNAANGSLPSSGNFVTNVVVNGTTVTVRGSVVNGTIRIGTMFVP